MGIYIYIYIYSYISLSLYMYIYIYIYTHTLLGGARIILERASRLTICIRNSLGWLKMFKLPYNSFNYLKIPS